MTKKIVYDDSNLEELYKFPPDPPKPEQDEEKDDE